MGSQVRKSADWAVFDAQTNAIATASRTAGEASGGQSHHITHASASFDDATVVGRIRIDAASGSIRLDFQGHIALDFSSPLRGEPGGAVSVSVTAGGTGVLGRANMAGYTG